MFIFQFNRRRDKLVISSQDKARCHSDYCRICFNATYPPRIKGDWCGKLDKSFLQPPTLGLHVPWPVAANLFQFALLGRAERKTDRPPKSPVSNPPPLSTALSDPCAVRFIDDGYHGLRRIPRTAAGRNGLVGLFGRVKPSICQSKAQLSLLAEVTDMVPVGLTAHDRLRLFDGDGYHQGAP